MAQVPIGIITTIRTFMTGNYINGGTELDKPVFISGTKPATVKGLRWTLKRLQNGNLAIRSNLTQGYLTAKEGGEIVVSLKSDDEVENEESAQWRTIETEEDGYYVIQNVASGGIIDAKNDEIPIVRKVEWKQKLQYYFKFISLF